MMKGILRISLIVVLIGSLSAVFGGCAGRQQAAGAGVAKAVEPSTPVPLIPREVIFGNPERAAGKLSPDGRYISFMAPFEGVLNVWVGDVDNPVAAKAVTKVKGRGVMFYFWAYTNRHIVYGLDQGGDENWRLIVLDIETGKELLITPEKGVKAQVTRASYRHPEEMAVELNDRDPRFHDVYRVNILTGERKLIQKNDRFIAFELDLDFNVRIASEFGKSGERNYYTADGAGGWKPLMTLTRDDSLTTAIFDFDKTGRTVYLVDSRGRDKSGLFSWNLDTGERKLLAEDAKADIQDVLIHPTERTILAAFAKYDRIKALPIDGTIAPDLEAVSKISEGDYDISNTTLDNSKWTVVFDVPNGPKRWYLYDRATKTSKFLFSHRPKLEGLKLARMYPTVIKSRDGLDLVAYLSIPSWLDKGGRPEHPIPLVLNVHGGPWYRDSWGYTPEHQWLTNRGYAVLSVNYRGSTGFGKAFINAGDGEWGGRMLDDLIDAVNWAVGEKIAPKDKVAIMGWSFGGYSTLLGLTFTPDVFACGVDGVGISNVVTFLKNMPPYWVPFKEVLYQRAGGNPDTEAGRKFLESRSPLTFVDKIKKPLLIGQGANDPRVNQSEADQIVRAMKQRGIPVVYTLFGDEGHGFYRPENSRAFYSVADVFLSGCLGGRYEPIGPDFNGSSITVPEGATLVPGVREALEAKK